MKVGPYELVVQLGIGGFGETWEARHDQTGNRVALKLLHKKLTALVDAGKLADDVRAVARLAHAGIARLHDIGETADGHLYIVRELIDGESLAHRLLRGRFSSTQAADSAQQIARALHVARGAGIAHHDLKPSNIRYVHDAEAASRERLVILDFGMSNIVRAAPDCATQAYLAPEQRTGAPTHASDVFALGCLLYEMISTQPPKGATEVSLIIPDVAKSLDRLIALTLQPTQDRRPQSFADISRLLDMIVGLQAPLAETVRS